MIELHLTRPLKIDCHAALMTIGLADDKRRDILAVLTLAREHGGRVTPELICRELLMDRPVVVGRKVIARCAEWDLLTPDGAITDAGKYAIESGKIFVPETGKYRVWTTPDPLVPSGFLGLEPMEELPAPYAHREAMDSWTAKKNGRPGSNEARVLPKSLLDLKGRVLTSVVGLSARLSVRDIQMRGEQLEVDRHLASTIDWWLSPDRPSRINTTGGIVGLFPPPAILDPVTYFNEVWLEVLGNEARNWVYENDAGVLKTGFPGTLKPAERLNMQCELKLQHPETKLFEKFDDATVSRVPVRPATARDANEWARWIQEETVNGYQSVGVFAANARQIASRFPGFEVSLRTRDELAERLRESMSGGADSRLPRAYWFVQAPIDLGDGERATRSG